MIRIAGLQALSNRLGRLDMSAVQHEALEEAASVLKEAIRDSLSHPPGSTRDAPWLRSGTLRASIECQNDENIAVIGSSDPVAVDQEQGTGTIPPRPFFAPSAVEQGEQLAHEVARAIATELRPAMQGDFR